jgi:hypothetical protein
MNKEAAIRVDNNIKIGSSGELMSGGSCDRYAISRRTVVAHLGKTHNLSLDDLSEREEQRGDLKGDQEDNH